MYIYVYNFVTEDRVGGCGGGVREQSPDNPLTASAGETKPTPRVGGLR